MTMNRPAPSTERKEGFTLVEVMLALGVFAIAVVGLITALNTAMQAAIEVRERSLLRAELETVRPFDRGWCTTAQLSGQTAMGTAARSSACTR